MVIRARFDVITSLSQRLSVFLQYQDLLQVPSIGDVINIKCNPYVVHSVGWALPSEDEGEFDEDEGVCQYAYVDLLPGAIETCGTCHQPTILRHASWCGVTKKEKSK